MSSIQEKRKDIREYYGKILKNTKDLKSGACCNIEYSSNPDINKIIGQIDDEILTKFYGCGSPIPADVRGCVVLDLGCGTGRDAFILSSLVGPDGSVIGVDMTDEQLEVGKKYIDTQMKKFRFTHPNVVFKKGFIEDLSEIGIKDNSVDIVVSNCVINLSPDKPTVFSEIFRVLKPGGELYFSDIFTGRRIPEHLKDDPVLHGECLGGAMYVEDFRRLLAKLNCPDYRVVSKQKITLNNPEIEKKIGMVDFYSMTVRAFKLNELEDKCEDYGQTAKYLGTIPGYPYTFNLDDHHIFITGKPMLVCGNTASMLQNTRFAKHFKVEGNQLNHYGLFDCAPESVKLSRNNGSGGACC